MSEVDTLKNLYRKVNQAMVDKDIETLSQVLQDGTELVHMTGYHLPVGSAH